MGSTADSDEQTQLLVLCAEKLVGCLYGSLQRVAEAQDELARVLRTVVRQDDLAAPESIPLLPVASVEPEATSHNVPAIAIDGEQVVVASSTEDSIITRPPDERVVVCTTAQAVVAFLAGCVVGWAPPTKSVWIIIAPDKLGVGC